jgi:16S rRNA (guanine527-N7)-methyltransferase
LSDPQSPNQLDISIRNGLTAIGMQPDAQPVDAYVRYIQLLQEWNRVYNLTAIRKPEKIVTQHILDSLSVLPLINGDVCLDVGTGAGLPGLILALVTPDKQWVLLDSNHKKIRFVNQAIIELKIPNVKTECVRVERFSTKLLFTTIIARAFGSLNSIYTQTRHLLAPGGSLLAMKGKDIASELSGLDEGTVTVQAHTFNVPGIRQLRSVVEFRAFRVK